MRKNLDYNKKSYIFVPMLFNIDLEKEDLKYEAYLSCINAVFVVNKLTDLEIRVLGKFIYIKNMYSHLDEDKLKKLLFHKETKKRIRQSLNNMTEAVFNNTTKSLREKNFLKYDKVCIPIPEENEGVINISFSIKWIEKENSL